MYSHIAGLYSLAYPRALVSNICELTSVQTLLTVPSQRAANGKYIRTVCCRRLVAFVFEVNWWLNFGTGIWELIPSWCGILEH